MRLVGERFSIGAMERMVISSINVGDGRTLEHRGRRFLTGIDKQPRSGAVTVTADGLADDAVCDLEHHGGRDQAVYAYAAADYESWSARLGRSLRPGTFGENLTIDGMPPDLNAGDRLLIGDVLLEATAPRIPCNTLAATMQDQNFGLEFRRAERPGVYFRVLNGGEIRTGDRVTLIENTDTGVSMLELFRLCYEPQPPHESLERALDAPIAERLRDRFSRKLESIVAGSSADGIKKNAPHEAGQEGS